MQFWTGSRSTGESASGSEGAQTAGLSQTKAVSVAKNWGGARLVAPER
ncbi:MULTISPECIES: DUF3052 family protein [unclassified Streptomyces]|nr:DUF3052 domain-containing protein [Streptomyces sp. NBC_01023]